MIDYSDGKWHDWFGGDCPVDRYQIVEVIRRDHMQFAQEAERFDWAHLSSWNEEYESDIIAFRTVADDDEDPFMKHVALILIQDGCKVGDARWRAWFEGPSGYDKRLNKTLDESL